MSFGFVSIFFLDWQTCSSSAAFHVLFFFRVSGVWQVRPGKLSNPRPRKRERTEGRGGRIEKGLLQVPSKHPHNNMLTFGLAGWSFFSTLPLASFLALEAACSRSFSSMIRCRVSSSTTVPSGKVQLVSLVGWGNSGRKGTKASPKEGLNH